MFYASLKINQLASGILILKGLALENKDTPLSPIPTDASVKYFFSFYQNLSCRNSTCYRNISTQKVWRVDNLLGTKQKEIMKEILLVCFGSLLLSLELDLDMMTTRTIMHTTVILIFFCLLQQQSKPSTIQTFGSSHPKMSLCSCMQIGQVSRTSLSYESLQAHKK